MRTRLVEPARVQRTSVLLLAALVVGALFTGLGSPLSLIVGGAFMLADFYLIRVLVSRLIRPGAGRVLAFGGLALKFLLVLALVAAVFYQWPVEPLSFAAGASVLLVAAVIDATLLGAATETIEP